MSARVLYLILKILSILYSFVLMMLQDIQRKKKLPEEVADVYDPGRYQKYLDHTADKKRLSLINTGIDLIADTILIFSPLYSFLERALAGNVYLITIFTLLIFILIESLIEIPADYYATFNIEEKYGLNKKDKKEFVKDEVLDLMGSLILMTALGLLITFVGEHMASWTKGFTLGVKKTLILSLSLGLGALIFALLASLYSLFLMRKRYTFTPLEEGELKKKIMDLQKDSKKKVYKIYVYNESKKSTSKNAALLKLLWHREFWIADNFLNENSERELLGVLSHEIGHLKHKKNVLNYLSYLFTGLILVLLIYLLMQPSAVFKFTAYVRNSFGISGNNYYVLLLTAVSVFSPLSVIFGMFSNYRSRREEYEADQEAVRNGYGEDLITTFKTLSHDELVNVYPHPFIEFLEYDHPAMYHRIRAIRKKETT